MGRPSGHSKAPENIRHENSVAQLKADRELVRRGADGLHVEIVRTGEGDNGDTYVAVMSVGGNIQSYRIADSFRKRSKQ